MEKYHIHRLIWHNRIEALKTALESKEFDVEEVDARGRTPLHLAISLCRIRAVRILLENGASTNADNPGNWKPLHEAVSTGDPELIQLVLQYRDWHVAHWKHTSIPRMLSRLQDTPDFYVEMKWEFNSWVPLISRMCPSDTYRVWKRGNNLRVDTTLVGFDQNRWVHGQLSFMFVTQDGVTRMIELNHETRTASVQTLGGEGSLEQLAQPPLEQVMDRMQSALTTSYLDVDNIAFERAKSGIWGFRSDKSESVNGYECKVFSASNVQLVTKTRTEHLSESEKKEASSALDAVPFKSFLSMKEENLIEGGSVSTDELSCSTATIREEDYFDPSVDLEGRDVGRERHIAKRVQKLKASLWLSNDFPLSLPEQAVPVIELMSSNSAHFSRLKDFITLQLPAGFPVKIEIPMFHVLNARITFSNIHASSQSVEGVTCLTEAQPLACIVEDSVFDIPESYRKVDTSSLDNIGLESEEDALLQYALQQSLLDVGSNSDEVTFYEALGDTAIAPSTQPRPQTRPLPRPQRVMGVNEDERLLQLALEASLRDMKQSVDDQSVNTCSKPCTDAETKVEETTVEAETGSTDATATHSNIANRTPTDDFESQMALALSLSMQEEMNKQQLPPEPTPDEEFERILKLSLTEK